jgi:hypothetical protein
MASETRTTPEGEFEGVKIRLNYLTWSAVLGIAASVIAGSQWYSSVENRVKILESAVQARTDDRYRARDAMADFAIRDARIGAIEGQVNGVGKELGEIKSELRELNAVLRDMFKQLAHEKRK